MRANGIPHATEPREQDTPCGDDDAPPVEHPFDAFAVFCDIPHEVFDAPLTVRSLLLV